ncbi:uncharacterized protein LOC103710406 [Phoenix dactylifera]|uniref:Uncharacterized protein LOC103710406 n=1 Tax=Phoenix dactylifera TaxID=42345 RepID=A0A8B9ABC4_PHODC|nr:uncharacterized protein LOC103710406 [Phoenix dactylifera]XP_038983835.1 uncharacterized protein LOC103710406 [Phoenix dactylifera]
MARRGRKRAVAESPLKPKTNQEAGPSENRAVQFAERQRGFNNREVERRIAAIQAIRAAETENLLSRLRLLRSYLSKEQLETPAITFFQKNLPNLSVIRNEKYKVFELQWNDNNCYLPGNQVDGRNVRASLDNVGGLQFSVNSVKKNLLEAANLQIPDFILNEPSENQMPGTRDFLQTPGATSNRLSFGMTPKTLRLPKNGEMLLSVHGSPLGVYKEDNLAAIHESGDGSHDGAF